MTYPATTDDTDRAAGHEKVVQAVVHWLRSELDDPEITESENFLDIGGHSLTFSKLNVFLGGSFEVVLDQKITYELSLSEAVAEMRPVETGK